MIHTQRCIGAHLNAHLNAHDFKPHSQELIPKILLWLTHL